MPMKFSTRVVNALITNIPIAIVLSFVATYLGMKDQPIPPEAFMGAYLHTVLINIALSYVIATLVGIFIPLPMIGMKVCEMLNIKPSDGAKFGLVMNAVINFFYVLILSPILAYFNACVMNGAPIQAVIPGALSSFIPCYIAAFIVALLWAQRAEAIARKICNDPAPAMH